MIIAGSSDFDIDTDIKLEVQTLDSHTGKSTGYGVQVDVKASGPLVNKEKKIAKLVFFNDQWIFFFSQKLFFGYVLPGRRQRISGDSFKSSNSGRMCRAYLGSCVNIMCMHLYLQAYSKQVFAIVLKFKIKSNNSDHYCKKYISLSFFPISVHFLRCSYLYIIDFCVQQINSLISICFFIITNDNRI